MRFKPTLIVSMIAVFLMAAFPVAILAHGGIGGFHGGGGFHAGGFHAGGFHTDGVHVGGVHGVGGYGVGGLGYPHYHPGVGYYHPVARTAALGAAYNAGINANLPYYGSTRSYGSPYPAPNPAAYPTPNPYTARDSFVPLKTPDSRKDAEATLNKALKEDK